MSVTMECKVTFEFTGKLKNCKWKQERVIRDFLKQRGLLVDILNNGIIDNLNKEFDVTHKWYEGIYFDKDYKKFIQEGQQKWADIVNKNAGTDIDVELFIDEDGDIYGKTTHLREICEIHMGIKI